MPDDTFLIEHGHETHSCKVEKGTNTPSHIIRDTLAQFTLS
jgi:hypothetical protein